MHTYFDELNPTHKTINIHHHYSLSFPQSIVITIVHRLIEESAIHSSKHEFTKALEKAKEAGKKEKALCKHRDDNGLADQHNIDLTYSVWFCMANGYQQNGMMEVSLSELSYELSCSN